MTLHTNKIKLLINSIKLTNNDKGAKFVRCPFSFKANTQKRFDRLHFHAYLIAIGEA